MYSGSLTAEIFPALFVLLVNDPIIFGAGIAIVSGNCPGGLQSGVAAFLPWLKPARETVLRYAFSKAISGLRPL
jgi:hypothetical protein